MSKRELQALEPFGYWKAPGVGQPGRGRPPRDRDAQDASGGPAPPEGATASRGTTAESAGEAEHTDPATMVARDTSAAEGSGAGTSATGRQTSPITSPAPATARKGPGAAKLTEDIGGGAGTALPAPIPPTPSATGRLRGSGPPATAARDATTGRQLDWVGVNPYALGEPGPAHGGGGGMDGMARGVTVPSLAAFPLLQARPMPQLPTWDRKLLKPFLDEWYIYCATLQHHGAGEPNIWAALTKSSTRRGVARLVLDAQGVDLKDTPLSLADLREWNRAVVRLLEEAVHEREDSRRADYNKTIWDYMPRIKATLVWLNPLLPANHDVTFKEVWDQFTFSYEAASDEDDLWRQLVDSPVEARVETGGEDDEDDTGGGRGRRGGDRIVLKRGDQRKVLINHIVTILEPRAFRDIISNVVAGYSIPSMTAFFTLLKEHEHVWTTLVRAERSSDAAGKRSNRGGGGGVGTASGGGGGGKGASRGDKPGQGKSGDKVCHHCHQTGHFIRNCPVRKAGDDKTPTATGTTSVSTTSGGGGAGAAGAGGGSQPPKAKFTGSCRYCDKVGHKELDCRKKQRDAAAGVEKALRPNPPGGAGKGKGAGLDSTGPAGTPKGAAVGLNRVSVVSGVAAFDGSADVDDDDDVGQDWNTADGWARRVTVPGMETMDASVRTDTTTDASPAAGALAGAGSSSIVAAGVTTGPLEETTTADNRAWATVFMPGMGAFMGELQRPSSDQGSGTSGTTTHRQRGVAVCLDTGAATSIISVHQLKRLKALGVAVQERPPPSQFTIMPYVGVPADDAVRAPIVGGVTITAGRLIVGGALLTAPLEVHVKDLAVVVVDMNDDPVHPREILLNVASLADATSDTVAEHVLLELTRATLDARRRALRGHDGTGTGDSTTATVGAVRVEPENVTQTDMTATTVLDDEWLSTEAVTDVLRVCKTAVVPWGQTAVASAVSTTDSMPPAPTDVPAELGPGVGPHRGTEAASMEPLAGRSTELPVALTAEAHSQRDAHGFVTARLPGQTSTTRKFASTRDRTDTQDAEVDDEESIDVDDDSVGVGFPDERFEQIWGEVERVLLTAHKVEGLSAAAYHRLRAAAWQYRDVFRCTLNVRDPPVAVAPVHIDVDADKLFQDRSQYRRYGREETEFLKAIFEELESAGVVERVASARYTSFAHVVPKAGVAADAPLTKRYRAVVSLVGVNRRTRAVVARPMYVQDVVARASGHRWQGTVDFASAFWLLALAEDSQQFFVTSTPHGLWKWKRLPQGATDSMAFLRAAMEETLGTLQGFTYFADDGAVFSDDESEFVDRWTALLARCAQYGWKVNASKWRPFARRLPYLGRVLIAGGGTAFSEAYLTAVTSMKPPVTAHDLQRALGAFSYTRDGVPQLAKLMFPLTSLLAKAMQTAGARTKSALRKVQLSAVGWDDAVHGESLRRVLWAVRNAMVLATPDPINKRLCLFTDASCVGWAGVLTQVPHDELTKPPAEQQHHELLLAMSGLWHGSATSWGVIDQETMGLVESVRRALPIIRGCEVLAYTDHRNVAWLCGNELDGVPPQSKQCSDRLERARAFLASVRIHVRYSPGDAVSHSWPDSLTRFAIGHTDRPLGVTTADETAAPTVGTVSGTAATVPVRAVLTRHAAQAASATAELGVGAVSPSRPAGSADHVPAAVAVGSSSRATGGHVAGAAVAPLVVPRVQAASPAAVTRKTGSEPVTAVREDNDAAIIEGMAIMDANDVPNMDEIRRAQQVALAAKEFAPELLRLEYEAERRVYVRQGTTRVYLPARNQLRLRVTVCAHQGSGHFAGEVTAARVRSHFWWDGWKRDVKRMCENCLACVKCRHGWTVPRHRLRAAYADKPAALLCADHLFMHTPTAGEPASAPTTLLVLMDAYSKFCYLTPCKSADSTSVVHALLTWTGLFGAPDRFVSDRGTAFDNAVVREFCERSNTLHELIPAGSHWTAGRVEQRNSVILSVARKWLASYRLPYHEWSQLVAPLMDALNSAPSRELGWLSPRQVMTGRPGSEPLRAVYEPDARAFRELAVTAEDIQAAHAELTATLAEYQERVDAVPARKRGDKTGSPIDFGVGDLVLHARQEHQKRGQKLSLTWLGPKEVTRQRGDVVFDVRDLITGEEIENVHGDFLCKYSDKKLTLTTEARDLIAYADRKYLVAAFVGHRFLPGGSVQLKTEWVGFSEPTFEPLRTMLTDVPTLVDTYVKLVGDRSERERLQKIVLELGSVIEVEQAAMAQRAEKRARVKKTAAAAKQGSASAVRG